jgi:putative hydrolase of the HAD superfamily
MERDVDLTAFDAVVESFAVGARKPEPAIYERTAQIRGVEPEEIIYHDDFDQNLVPARARGGSTIHVGDPDEALLELGQLVSDG